jgi:hypothetical protein
MATTTSSAAVTVMDKAHFTKEISNLAREIRSHDEDDTTSPQWQALKVSLSTLLEGIGKYFPDFELVLACLELAIEMNDNEDETVRNLSYYSVILIDFLSVSLSFTLSLSLSLTLSLSFFLNSLTARSIVKSSKPQSLSVAVTSSVGLKSGSDTLISNAMRSRSVRVLSIRRKSSKSRVMERLPRQ